MAAAAGGGAWEAGAGGRLLEGLGLLPWGRWEPCRVLSIGGTSVTSFPSSTLSGDRLAAAAGPGAARADGRCSGRILIPQSWWGVAKAGAGAGRRGGSLEIS